MAKTVLVTAFEPFAGQPDNASEAALGRVKTTAAVGVGAELIKAVLPVSFARALPKLLELCRLHRPEIILCLGEAGGRSRIGFERVAVNLADARIPDNDGAQPVDASVVPGGPNAYFTSLPVKRMARAARSAGAPAEVSLSAGSFVCNAVFYGLVHHAETQDGLRVGFAHVPWAPGQAGASEPSLDTETAARGLEAGLRAAIEGGDADIEPEGMIH